MSSHAKPRTSTDLIEALRASLNNPPPLPGSGRTPERHRRLMQLGREDLSLARLAEAHWDAVAILAEAGRTPCEGAVYGVWAAEMPGKALELTPDGEGYTISGTKMFCSGAGLIDRALITAGRQLVDIDLRHHAVQDENGQLYLETAGWHTSAFALTNTATATFRGVPVEKDDLIGKAGFYLSRPGFWHGACGPAACWAGGAAGLVDWAMQQRRDDPHTLAHLGAMRSELWALEAVLDTAGREIDAEPQDADAAHVRALTVRHLVERACTDILRRLARAYGPHPLAFVGPVSQRYQELDLYVRQSHAERDLEALGRAVHAGNQAKLSQDAILASA
jgi:alkylation response protein AidB-like acyl-CoA dehydrogenase